MSNPAQFTGDNHMEPKYPDVEVQLVGQDGNAFAILSRVTRALKAGGAPQEEVDKFWDEATDGNYDDLLNTVRQWVVVA